MGLHSFPKMGANHRIHTPHPAPKFRSLEQTNAGIGISGSDSAILPAAPDCGGGGRHRWNQSGNRKPKADLRTRFLFGAPLRLLLLLCRSAAFVVVKTEKGHLPTRSLVRRKTIPFPSEPSFGPNVWRPPWLTPSAASKTSFTISRTH